MQIVHEISNILHFCKSGHFAEHTGQAQGKDNTQNKPVFICSELIFAFIQSAFDHHAAANDQRHAGDIGQPLDRIPLRIRTCIFKYVQHDTADRSYNEQTDKRVKNHHMRCCTVLVSLTFIEFIMLENCWNNPDKRLKKCFIVQRTGVYAAGAIRRAMTIEESIEDATGAALKAIQCIESANRGMAVHPRSGDMTYPEFFFQRCTQCKRCTVECPFGALDDDEKGTPKANPTRCRRCGTCMGACPERIISFADYTIDSIGSQIKAVKVPSEDDYSEPPFRFIALVCENDAFPALDMVGMNKIDYSPNVRVIPVRCLGSVNTIWIKDALAQGMDGVILIGCKHGDDYQCHFMKGSELAEVRVKKIGDALSSLALEEERVAFAEVAIDEYDKLPGIINAFVKEVEDLGPNPFKGF